MPWETSFDEKEVLTAAMQLFWAQGYEHTSMADLVKATKASRHGLYDVFGDKQELFVAVLDCYRREVVEKNMGPLLSDNASLGSIKAYFASFSRFAESENSQFGCLVCHTAVGIASREPVIGNYVRDFFAWMTEVFRRALQNAKRLGEISAEASPTQLARFLTGLVQGAAVYFRAGVDTKIITSFVSTGLSVLAK